MSHEILSQDLASLAAERPEAPRLDPSDAAALAASLSYAPAELPPGAWEELEAKLAANDAAPRVSLSCTYCHDGLRTSGGQAVAYCASCLAPHHLDCFEDHARCSAPGCAETRWVQPQSSGGAPLISGPASGMSSAKPALQVLGGADSEAAEPGEPERRRKIPALAWVLAASFLGVGAAALNLVRTGGESPIAMAPTRTLVLAYANDLPAGAFVTQDDFLQKEMGRVAYEALRASDDPPVSESDLAGFLGRRLETRVFAGQPVRVRQFRTSTQLTPGATLIACVFTHDVEAGQILTKDDLERRQVGWQQIWSLPDQGLIHESHLDAYVGRRLTSRGTGGEPLRYSHFEEDALLGRDWEPTPAEQALALSKQGRRLLRLARPVERARAYLIHHGLAERVDLEQVEIASYCPPQQTVYAWLVTFPNTGGGEPIMVAVSEAGRTWQLDAQLEPVRTTEFKRGGLLPDEAKRPRQNKRKK